MTVRQSIRGRLRQMAAEGLRHLADSVLDVADLLDDGDEGATDTDANDADNDITNTRDPIAVALKGCVEIPSALPAAMRALNKHYTSMKIDGITAAWRTADGEIHIVVDAHDATLPDYLNRHITQFIMGDYE